MPCTVETVSFNGRGAVEMKNDEIAVIIVSGGGHIVSIRVPSIGADVPDVNPLWTPSWPTVDPALRKLACQTGMQPGELEGELLCGISGLNLCCTSTSTATATPTSTSTGSTPKEEDPLPPPVYRLIAGSLSTRRCFLVLTSCSHMMLNAWGSL